MRHFLPTQVDWCMLQSLTKEKYLIEKYELQAINTSRIDMFTRCAFKQSLNLLIGNQIVSESGHFSKFIFETYAANSALQILSINCISI